MSSSHVPPASTKPLRVAGEVDSWCTRCRLLLNHRIVSMKVGAPHQVECLTCRSQHLWRARAPGESAPASPRSASRTSPGSAGKAARTGGQPALRQQQRWEAAILGRGPLEFKAYQVSATYADGDLLRHKKFGDGVVTRIIDEHKIEVLFRDEARTLAQGMR